MARKDKIRNYRRLARKRTSKRLWKRSTEPVKIKEVPGSKLDSSGKFQFILYLNEQGTNRRENVLQTKELKEFLKSAISNKFKLQYESNRWTKERWITSIKLEDETDLFTIMLCHNDKFRKIFKLIHEKETA
jgi:hypothetical protein